MNTQELVALCNQQFNEKFGENPQKIVLSPGRINIIGEHIERHACSDCRLTILTWHLPITFTETAITVFFAHPAKRDGNTKFLPWLELNFLTLERPFTLGVGQKFDKKYLFFG